MKQVCLHCGRVSAGGDLFCQETYCPCEMSPTILDSGDWFGDIEIVKPVIVLRSAVLYEAMHQKKKIFLKVAHPGQENKERLKREAEFLQTLQARKLDQKTLPQWLPPYAFPSPPIPAYGKTMLRGHLLYFYLSEHWEGEPLRDALRRNPQLWINHVGWLMVGVGATVNFLHTQGRYHLGLSPDSVLVRFDEKPNVPRVLLFDLGIATDRGHANQEWHAFAVPPAYLAPELIDADHLALAADFRTDVYGLGMVLYELLVGEPAFAFKLRGDRDVIQAILRGQRVAMNRIEDVSTTADVALQATRYEPAERQSTAYEFTQQLRKIFGDPPPPKRRIWPSLNTVFLIVIVLLIIVFLIMLAMALTPGR
jgi:serine/threonine protein kinase